MTHGIKQSQPNQENDGVALFVYKPSFSRSSIFSISQQNLGLDV